MPLILGTNSIKDTGYDVANSCRFDDGSSTQMNKTISSTSTTWTFSCWIKLNPTGTNQYLASWDMGSGESLGIGIEASTNQLFIYTSSTGQAPKLYDGKLRDPSAWMNIVIKNSSGTITSYINGIQAKTSITGTALASGTLRIGCWTGSNFFYDGYMSEVVLIDGTAYSADSFGEFDEDSGIWKPIDVSGLTFGTNGFYLDFKDSSALGNDVSGNNNDFTVNNLTAIDQSTDTCTNNFATLNPIAFSGAGDRLSEGNLRLDGTSSSAHSLGIGTIAVNQGKWWFEAEIDAIGGTYPQIGVRSVDVNNTVGSYVAQITGGAGYASHGTIAVDGSNVSTGGTTYTSGDIINVGLDLDSNKIYWYKNGTLMNSGGTTITNRYYTFAVSQYSNTGHWFCNFGAGTIYTISSGNTDADGYGNFSMAVPSGYYSLNSKNLAEYG
ncbi:spry domain protein [uncultured Mediterranean phage uvMED]|nr:spry domain protein [uncultured Mediterranean phage uvMED]